MTNEDSDIRLERVSFDSDGATLIGNLYRPAPRVTCDASALEPAVVVTGTWTSVKEQMANRYAAKLAQRGLTALSFDFTGYGESGGEPRDYESPELKVRDIHNAVTFLVAQPGVDTDRIGALGVCAGAGYTAVNAARDSRVKVLALVAPWLHNAQIVREIYGGQDGVAQRTKAGEDARQRYEQTGEVAYVPAVSADDPLAAMPLHIDFYENPARGALPQWPNRFAVMAWPGWLTFDPISLAPQLTTPTLVVHSEDAAVPQGAHQFLETFAGEITPVWTTGTQFDFYDQDPTVNSAADLAAEHFHSRLPS